MAWSFNYLLDIGHLLDTVYGQLDSKRWCDEMGSVLHASCDHVALLPLQLFLPAIPLHSGIKWIILLGQCDSFICSRRTWKSGLQHLTYTFICAATNLWNTGNVKIQYG